jgi:hypothetical protein
MNRAMIFATTLLCVVASAQVQQRQWLSGRYFTPDTLLVQLQNAGTERAALSYLEGTYDLTQDAGQSCAQRGTTTPILLEKVFTDYLQANPDLLHADRTAGGIAAQAFAQYWPCQSR